MLHFGMLVAHFQGMRIDADEAQRGAEFSCPNCNDIVILKRGRIKIAHFAHKPPYSCSWASGETVQHQQAKRKFAEALNARGVNADVEVYVPSLPGPDRRADVLAKNQKGTKVAVELQHTNISLEEIAERTQSYIDADIGVVWISLIDGEIIENGDVEADGRVVVERFPARPWQKWAHGLAFGEHWFLDVDEWKLWRGRFSKHEIYVESTSWYENGEEMSAGGYLKYSKRWRRLTLTGPFDLSKVLLKRQNREQAIFGDYEFPGGVIATLTI
jgi:hypothetical protein